MLTKKARRGRTGAVNMDADRNQRPQFSYEEIPGRNQGVIYCHWPITFRAYFFIRDIRLGRFLLLPEHKNERTSKLVERMRSWFFLTYVKPRSTGFENDNETGNILVKGAT